MAGMPTIEEMGRLVRRVMTVVGTVTIGIEIVEFKKLNVAPDGIRYQKIHKTYHNARFVERAQLAEFPQDGQSFYDVRS